MVAVGCVCSFELRWGHWGNAILEEELRQCCATLLRTGDVSCSIRLSRDVLVVVVAGEQEALVHVNFLVLLREATFRRHLDNASFTAVQHDLAILTLQRQANTAGNPESEDRAQEEECAQPVG